jgi:hypothetical protein
MREMAVQLGIDNPGENGSSGLEESKLLFSSLASIPMVAYT